MHFVKLMALNLFFVGFSFADYPGQEWDKEISESCKRKMWSIMHVMTSEDNPYYSEITSITKGTEHSGISYTVFDVTLAFEEDNFNMRVYAHSPDETCYISKVEYSTH